jgi:titin
VPTTCVITGLTNATTYTVTVVGINVNGSSPPSTPVTVTPNTTPDAPAAPVATAGNAQATVTWVDLTTAQDGGTPVTGYTVTSVQNSTLSCSAGPSATSCIVTGLTNTDTYTFTVAATAGGTGPSSPPSNPVTPVAPPDVPGTPVLSIPTPFAAYDLTANWSPPATHGITVTGYDVRYTSDGGSTWSSASPVGTNSDTLTGLSTSLSYATEVAATYAGGVTAWSAPSNYLSPEAPPAVPAAPVETAAGSDTIAVAWSAPPTYGVAVTGYELRYSSNAGSSWSSPTAESGLTGSLTGLSTSLSYISEVAATYAGGQTGWSLPSNSVSPSDVPAAPAAPTATNSGLTAIALTWVAPASNNSPITGYAIQYSSNAGSTWTSYTSNTGSTALTATISGLSAGTTYVEEVKAINAIGPGAWSPQSNPVTTPSLPGAPAAPNATNAGVGAIAITWSTPSSNGSAITAYTIRDSSDGGTTWSIYTSNTGSPSLSATLSSLANNTSYVEEVAAINGVGTGPWSPASNAVTTPTVPTAPCSVVATGAGAGAISITWTTPTSCPSGNNGGSAITSYAIQYSSNGGSTWTSYTTNTGSTSTAATLSGLAASTSYVEEVAATNGVGTGPWSTPFSNSVTTASLPSAPSITSISYGGYTSWSTPSANGSAITGYALQYSTNGGASWNTITSNTGLTNSYNVSSYSTYELEVAAINGVGTGGWSAPAQLPSAPNSVGAYASSSTQATVNWSPPSTYGIPSYYTYVLQYSSNGGASWSYIGSVGNTSSYTISLASGTYYFEVAAVNTMGQGPWSSASGAVTIASVPSSPTGVTASNAGAATQYVTWGVPANNGSAITGYTVQQYNGLTGTAVGSPENTSGTSIYLATQVTQVSEDFYYTVTATNGVGTSSPGYSNYVAPYETFTAYVVGGGGGSTTSSGGGGGGENSGSFTVTENVGVSVNVGAGENMTPGIASSVGGISAGGGAAAGSGGGGASGGPENNANGGCTICGSFGGGGGGAGGAGTSGGSSNGGGGGAADAMYAIGEFIPVGPGGAGCQGSGIGGAHCGATPSGTYGRGNSDYLGSPYGANGGVVILGVPNSEYSAIASCGTYEGSLSGTSWWLIAGSTTCTF